MAQKQMHVSMPKEWLDQLEQLASSYSHRKVRTRSHFDVIREVVRGKYVTAAGAPPQEMSPIKKAG